MTLSKLLVASFAASAAAGGTLEFTSTNLACGDGGINEISVTGSMDKIDYELTRTDDGTTLELSTDMDDVGSLSVEIDVDAQEATSVSLERDLDVGDNKVASALSFNPGSGKSKLSLSTVLGSGVEVTADIDDLGGDRSTSMEVSYETDLGDGRTLTATVDPMNSSGEVEIA